MLLWLPAMLGLTSCSLSSLANRRGEAIDYSPATSVTGAESLRIAESYRSYRWRPTVANAFHGDDARGIRVDTPDHRHQPATGDDSRPGWWVPGRTNVGIPYQWGGFDTPISFGQALKNGKYAGDIYTLRKRALLDDAVSDQACGIDCSGFISRCWRLDRSYSTRELAGLCDPLEDFSKLRAGDLVNKNNVHALLFVEWVDTDRNRFVAYETGSPPTWKVLRHPISVAYAADLGYLPYRYRGMRD